MKRFWLLVTVLLLFLSCNRKKIKLYPPPDEVKDTTVINPEPIQLDTTGNNITNFKGLYTYGDEVSTFRDCKTGKLYWLTDSSKKMSKLYLSVNRSPAYPYESVYAEIKGYLRGKSGLGYASEYENELIANSVIKIEGKNYKTACYPFEFIALGNEPFWSVEIIPAEDRIVLKDVGEEKVYQFPYKQAAVTGDVYRYTVTNSKNDKLVLSIRKANCSDGMSDRKYLYSAELTINDKLLKGCAIRKNDQLKDNP